MSSFPESLLNSNKNIYFFDFGANRGKITKEFKKEVQPKKVFCLEPNLKLFEKLAKKYNNDDQVEVENFALWDKNEDIEFLIGRKSDSTNSKAKEIAEDLNCTPKKFKKGSVTVTAVDCVEYVDKKNIPTENAILVFKMDIEGAEKRVLQRLIREKNLLRKLGYLFIEFHGLDDQEEISLVDDMTKINNSLEVYKEVGWKKYRRIFSKSEEQK